MILTVTAGRFSLLLSVLAVLALTGCENSTIRNKDIIGTWVNESGAEIRFEANGRFSYRNLPTVIFLEREDVFVSGDGDYWNLEFEDDEPYISLHFFYIEAIKSTAEERLYVRGNSLYFTFGLDLGGLLGNRLYFKKKPEN